MAFLEVFAEDDMVLRYWTGERVGDRVQTAFHIRLFWLGLCDADICVQQKYDFNLDLFQASSLQDNSIL